MRKEYDFTNARPSPYYAKLGAAGRKALAEWYAATQNVVHLDDDVAEAFPDEASVNQALRLVMQLRGLATAKPKRAASKGARKARARKRKAA